MSLGGGERGHDTLPVPAFAQLSRKQALARMRLMSKALIRTNLQSGPDYAQRLCTHAGLPGSCRFRAHLLVESLATADVRAVIATTFCCPSLAWQMSADLRGLMDKVYHQDSIYMKSWSSLITFLKLSRLTAQSAM
jgi:hypothetical protein